MSSEMTNMLITGVLVLVLLVIFIWLLRALMPSASQEARRAARDDFDNSGYETMEQVRRKEFSVIGLGAFAILICVVLVGGIMYMLWQSGFSATPEDMEGLNTLLIFIPAIVMLVMVVSASRRYVRHQQIVLREYRVFRSRREQAIKEYEGKRSGSDKEKKAEKKKSVRRVSKPKRKGPPKLR